MRITTGTTNRNKNGSGNSKMYKQQPTSNAKKQNGYGNDCYIGVSYKINCVTLTKFVFD